MLPRTIRVKFRKTGDLQFISHLDLMRFMTKALVRARIPVVYTEGFNPHPKLTFGLPLSVGTQSVTEVMEFKIDREMENGEILERLNRNLPSDLQAFLAYDAPAGVKLSAIGWAEYEVRLDRAIEPESRLSGEIVVQKQTKSGEKTVDIAPMIRRYEYDGKVLRLVLCADSQNYLNPELVVKLFEAEDYTILRTRCFLTDGETEFR